MHLGEDNMRDNEGCVAVLAVAIVVFLLVLFLGPLLMMLAWNYGVCIVIAAAVPCWQYWAWFWVDIFIGLIGAKFYCSYKFKKE